MGVIRFSKYPFRIIPGGKAESVPKAATVLRDSDLIIGEGSVLPECADPDLERNKRCIRRRRSGKGCLQSCVLCLEEGFKGPMGDIFVV